MAASIAQSAQRLEQVSHASVSIKLLQDNLEDMRSYSQSRFASVTQHNQALASDIAELLGQIHYQDVVRQCIERIRVAVGQRNRFLQNAVTTLPQDGAELTNLSEQLEKILNDYVAEEGRHRHSGRPASGTSGELKVELF